MKRYFTYILSFVMISCIAACTKSEDVVNPNAEGHMALRLVSSTMTRATTPGNGVGTGENDDNLKEDAIISADLYFFDGEGSGNAVWHHRAIFTNQLEEATISELTIPSNIMSAIFNTNTSQATLYVVANAPAGTLPTYEGLAEGETLPTMAQLKAYTISTTSWKTTTTPSSAQSSFVMDGEDKITKTNNEIGGTVALTRAAAKIELSITDVVSSVTVGDETWTPVLGDNDNGSTILVSLNYAVGGSYINGAYNKTFANDNTQQNYGFARDAAVTDKKAYNQAHPFYSYASDWGAGGANEPYLLLVVPWISSKPGTSQQNTFYQIPVGSLDAKQIKRNHYYKVKINVGTMGSFEPQTATEITPSYTVIDWSTGSITTDIKEARYLVVDQTEIEIFNQNEYSIGYASSHPDKTAVKILSVTRDDMSSEVVGTTTFYKGDGVTSIDAGVWDDDEKYKLLKGFNVALQNNMIVFTHDLVNEDENSSVNADSYPTSGDFQNVDDYDFAPYYITLEVSMEVDDNTTFSEQITIIQYPQLYAKASQNSDYGNGGGYNDDHNLMVNAYYCKENTQEYVYKVNTNQQTFGTAPGLWTGGNTNKNPNMYVVTATAFSSDSPYFIGDPRQLENDTDLINATWNHDSYSSTAQVSIWVNTVDINGKTRRLQYYYPTNQERVGNDANNPASYVTGYMVAPKFRVASSYSVTHNTNSKDLAEKRCASYQEDGYPAGRWRLPTYAEAAFMVKLSNEQKIPPLFNAGTPYWCAHGAFIPASDGTVTLNSTGSAQSVRCVYDEWYWGSGQIANKSTFTWGDKQR